MEHRMKNSVWVLSIAILVIFGVLLTAVSNILADGTVQILDIYVNSGNNLYVKIDGIHQRYRLYVRREGRAFGDDPHHRYYQIYGGGNWPKNLWVVTDVNPDTIYCVEIRSDDGSTRHDIISYRTGSGSKPYSGSILGHACPVDGNTPPNTPALVSPLNGNTVTDSATNLCLEDNGDPDNYPRDYRKFYYRVEKTDGSWSQESGWIRNTCWDITLPSIGTYRWHAKSGDGESSSNWTNWWSFSYSLPVTDTPVPTLTPTPPPQTRIIIDNDSIGFTHSLGWNLATDNWTRTCSGQFGDVRWTNSRRPSYSNDVDWAKWRPDIDTAGTYEVYVFVPGVETGKFDTQSARYKVHHAEGDTVVIRSQRANWCQWVSLGTFTFDAGNQGYVYLGDYTAGENPQTSVIADAIKFERRSSAPPTSPRTVVDDGGAGFVSTAGWNRSTTNWTRSCIGIENDARWTYSRRPGYTNDVDTVEWIPNLAQAGSYEVFFYVPGVNNGLEDTRHARYTIRHAGGETTVVRSQLGNWCQWVSLGVFYFNQGSEGTVYLGDYTGENTQRSVVADAMKWVYRDSELPPPTPTPTPVSNLDIVGAARADIGMPYNQNRGRSRSSGPYGPWHFERGVCTDVVIDAYVGGDAAGWPSSGEISSAGRRYGLRSATAMQDYFQRHQLYLSIDQMWQAGDILFVGKSKRGNPNDADHVGIVTEVDAQGQPVKFVHASYGRKRTIEQPMSWSWTNGLSVLGHGRLSSGSANNLTSLANSDYGLRVILSTPSHSEAHLYLYNDEGKFISRMFNSDFVASDDPNLDPYLPYASFNNTSSTQWAYVPDVTSGKYRVEIIGDAKVSHTLQIQVLDGETVIAEDVYEGDLQEGGILSSDITVSIDGTGTSLASNPPMAIPTLNTFENFKLYNLSGTLVISETTGTDSLHVTLEPTSFQAPFLEAWSKESVELSATELTIPAGGHREVSFSISPKSIHLDAVYFGAILIRSDDTYIRRIPLAIVMPKATSSVFLPVVIR